MVALVAWLVSWPKYLGDHNLDGPNMGGHSFSGLNLGGLNLGGVTTLVVSI